MLAVTVEKLYDAPGWRDADGSAWYKHLSALHFKGATGWAVGSGQMLHSNDGGLSWGNTVPLEIDRSISMPERVFTIDQQSVWVLLLAPRGADSCYYSTNAGREWNQKRLSLMIRPRDIFFVNESDGWILSDDGEIPAGDAMIHITHDGGNSWDAYPLEIKGSASRVRFINASQGMLIQHTTNRNRTQTICNLLTTSDGGYTWRLLKSFNRLIRDLCMVSENDFFVVGEGGFISRTTDGGISWRRTYTKTTDTFNVIEVSSQGRGVAGGDFGLLMVTENFGQQWTRYETDEELNNIVDLSFVRDDQILVAASEAIFSLSFHKPANLANQKQELEPQRST